MAEEHNPMAEETAIDKWKRFLETTPPNTSVKIPSLLRRSGMGKQIPTDIPSTAIDLHCEKDGGTRRFSADEGTYITRRQSYDFITYTCHNCRVTQKTFAVVVIRDDEGNVVVMKLGEFPPFSSPISPQIPKLLTKKADLELYRKGVRAMAQGLGIGAASYFRRIVEGQWELLVTKIRDAAQELGEDDLSVFNNALETHQFAKAVDLLKDALPEKLLILDGQNPLTLLYGPLSEQLHEMTDEECLQQAEDVREVLTALLENIGNALRDQAGLRAAANRLKQRRSSG